MSKRTNLMRLCFVLAAFLVVIVGLFMNQGLTAYIIALIFFVIAAIISKPRSTKKTK